MGFDMTKTVAVIGSGRMGSFVGRQLPDGITKIFIDRNEDKAKRLADATGGDYGLTPDKARDADVIAILVSEPSVGKVAEELAGAAKDGALILNMSTKGRIGEEIKKVNPAVSFVDVKIIGNAKVMAMGFPACAVVSTENPETVETVRSLLPGFAKVIQGNPQLVPQVNTIASKEGIRAAVEIRKQLKQFNLPEDVENIAIYTVCTGTMMSYVNRDLGEFGRKLADELEKNLTI